MANIFLSYDRDDQQRARPLAALLERSGHDVWWDRQIKGGREFGAEIEAALERAAKVVVLWSQGAVKSAWVRDEAAVGRDSGRLVPVTIDGTPPPLGFRQFQTIDLSGWKGRGRTPEIEEFLSAVETGELVRTGVGPPSVTQAEWKPGRRALQVAAVTALLALAAFLVWQLWPRAVTAKPTVTISGADDSAASRQFAADMATRIGALDPSQTAFQVADAGRSSSDYRLTVSGAAPGGHGSLTLIGPRKTTIWARGLDRGSASSDDFAQAASMTAQRALSCAAEALSYRAEKIDPDTLKLYVTACAQFDGAYDTNGADTSDANMLRAVLAKVPHFVAAWRKLFAIDTDNFVNSDIPRAPMFAELERARRLGIDVGEAYALRAVTLAPSDFLGMYRTFNRGIDHFPENAFLYRARSLLLARVGRMDDSVGDTNRAVQLDPLSPANAAEFAGALAYDGHTAEAFEQLARADRLWPNSPTLEAARSRLYLRFGDPKEAERLYLKTAAAGQFPQQWAFIQARIDPTPQKIEASLDTERRLNRQYPDYYSSIVQALAFFGRKDEAIDLLIHYPGGQLFGAQSEVMFRPYMRVLWRDPRSIAAAAHVGLLHFWQASGEWPDFCFDPTLPYDCRKEASKYRV